MRSPDLFLSDLIGVLSEGDVQQVYESMKAHRERELLLAVRRIGSLDADILRPVLSKETIGNFRSIKARLKQRVLDYLTGQAQPIDPMRDHTVGRLNLVRKLRQHGLAEHALRLATELYDSLDPDGYPLLRLMVLDEASSILKSDAALQGHWTLLGIRDMRLGIITAIHEQEELSRLADEAYLLQRSYRSSSKEAAALADGLLRSPFLSSPSEPQYFEARLRKQAALHFLAILKGDIPGAIAAQEQALTTWESQPWRIAQRPRVFQQAVINLINVLLDIGRLSEAEPLFAKAGAVEMPAPADAAAGFIALASVRLYYLMNMGQTEEAAAYCAVVARRLKGMKAQGPDSQLISLRANMLSALFLAGHSKEALAEAELIRAWPTAARLDLQAAAQALSLLCTIDRAGADLSESRLNQMAYFCKANPDVLAIGPILCKHIRPMIAEGTRKGTDGALSALLAELSELGMAEMQGLEECTLWALSRISGRPITDLYREGLRKKQEDRLAAARPQP